MSYMFEEGQTKTMLYGGVPDALGTRRQTRQDKDQPPGSPIHSSHPMKQPVFELPQKCSNDGLRLLVV